MSFKILILGRENVGKSNIFNRLVRKVGAITLKVPGVTRDYITRKCTLFGFDFYLSDASGWHYKQHNNPYSS